MSEQHDVSFLQSVVTVAFPFSLAVVLCLVLVNAKDPDSVKLREFWDEDAHQ